MNISLLTLIGGILAAVATVWQSFRNNQKWNELGKIEKLKQFLPSILLFVGALIVACSVWLSSLERSKKDEIINNKNNKIIALSDSIFSKSRTIERLNNEIIKINKDITNFQLGGNSYGRIYPLFILDEKNNEDIEVLYFENMGSYPLYDVEITMWNPDDLLKNRHDGRATIEDFEYYKNFKLGNISSSKYNGGRTIGYEFKLKNKELLKLNFSIIARNGYWSELLRMIEINGKLESAEKVTIVINKKVKVLFEKVSKNYPRNNNSIQWE